MSRTRPAKQNPTTECLTVPVAEPAARPAAAAAHSPFENLQWIEGLVADSLLRPATAAPTVQPPRDPRGRQVEVPQTKLLRTRPERKAAPGPYDQLATRIAAQFPPGRPAAVLFASPPPSASSEALVSAIASPLSDRVTGDLLVVDCDFHRPQLAARFGQPVRPSGGHHLMSVLRGLTRWQDAIHPTPYARIDLMPGGRLPQERKADELLAFAGLLDELRKNYQFVLLSGGSMTDNALMEIARLSDGSYLVLRLGQCGRRAARRAAQSLQGHGRLIGSILLS
jgi:Mrp family chromosome partitioning ATPase